MKRLLAAVLAWTALAVCADVGPIQPMVQGTVTISCTNSSGATTLILPSDQMQRQLEISNAGTVTVFVETAGTSPTAATASGYPVLAGQTKVITVSQAATKIACIATSGTQTVYVTTGIGQ